SRDELQRSREVVVVEHRLVDVLDDRVGSGVGSPLRVEARFGGVEEHAEDLGWVCGHCGRRKRAECQDDRRDDAPASPVAVTGAMHRRLRWPAPAGGMRRHYRFGSSEERDISTMTVGRVVTTSLRAPL